MMAERQAKDKWERFVPIVSKAKAMSRQRRTILILTCLLVSGCGLAPVRRPAASIRPRPRLIHCPGISGDSWFDRRFLEALKVGGFDAETELYDWTRGRWLLAALQDESANRSEGHKLARLIAERRRAEPGRRLYVSCESGGAGVVVWALEQLPEGVSVDGVLMLAPALSPHYDLSPALARVNQKMLVYYSQLDWLTLGIGTSLFGSIDRVYGEAAGRVGFQPPAAGQPALYAKLEQHPFSGDWVLRYGHMGGHIGPITARFAAGELAPRLRQLAGQGQEPR